MRLDVVFANVIKPRGWEPFQFPTKNGTLSLRPRWTADGNELFYIGTDGFLYTVPVDTGVTFSSGEPVALFDLDGAVSYDVAPDGRILVNVPLPEPPELNVVMDWTTALPR